MERGGEEKEEEKIDHPTHVGEGTYKQTVLTIQIQNVLYQSLLHKE